MAADVVASGLRTLITGGTDLAVSDQALWQEAPSRSRAGRAKAALGADRLDHMIRALTALTPASGIEELASRFLHECRLMVGAEHCGVVRFDRESGQARILAYESEVVNRRSVPDVAPLEWFKLASLIQDPVATLVHDMRAEKPSQRYARSLVELGLYSALDLPLVLRGQVDGALSFWGAGANRFSQADMDLLLTVTGPFALALERATALESLAESEARYRSLVSNAAEMIFVFDAESHRVMESNPHTAERLGYTTEELREKRLEDLVVDPADLPETRPPLVTSTGERRTLERLYLRKDGRQLEVDVVASPMTVAGREAILVLGRDASERKALQRQLIQGQKMESLGTMAGAVAHDFNNLLTTILGFAGLLKRSPGLEREDRENLTLIEDAAHRAADLTGRLLSFARGGLVRFGPIDLRQVIEDAVRLTEPAMHEALVVNVELTRAPVTVEGDSGQVQQALVNIVLNARDAMPSGGTIDIRLRVVGEDAVLTIRDDGPGMDEETRTRIFEPFFTTKPPGSGTGLGMAITYGIVQGHHGDIAVQSAPGKGTRFTIRLPLLRADLAAPAISDPGDGNLVLVVDDDEMVRRATTATLWQLGYSVAASPGGAVAVELVRARPERFSAVLLDLVMPGMTGSETFHELAGIRPDIPVIVCTGFAADKHIDADVKRRIAGLVRKPFTAEQLGAALQGAGVEPGRRPAGAGK
jgi:two-component system cell cycle sensor histidine kinase/response regulator CckA